LKSTFLSGFFTVEVILDISSFWSTNTGFSSTWSDSEGRRLCWSWSSWEECARDRPR